MATKKFQSQFAETPMAFLGKVSLLLLYGDRHAVFLQEAGAGVLECGMEGRCLPLCPDVHGQEFWAIHPWHAVYRGSEDKHEEEEECN